MVPKTKVEGLVDEIFDLVISSIQKSSKGYFWKRGALKVAKKVFKGGKIDVDYLVTFLTDQQKKNSPRDMNLVSLNHRALLMKALYSTIVDRVNEGVISDKVVIKIIKDRWGNNFFERIEKAKNEYLIKHKRIPPAFVLISPSKHCNLTCEGCYASSSTNTKDHLDYELIKKIIQRSHEEWGARSVAISGGEPLMYHSAGRTILDLAREFPFMYFKIYTNGTLITESIAKEMAELANISPAISLEGTELDTDKRRGDGTYKKIINAINHLKAVGVPVGISITATKHNMPTLLNPSFYDFLSLLSGKF